MDDFKLLARRMFCDWQVPDFLPEVALDAEYFVDKIVEIGGQSINFMCKSAFGNCLYPSKVGLSNKAIKGDGDIFGKVCKLGKSKGLQVVAYYNMVLNDAMGETHPEWLQVDKDGNPLLFESYKMFCMNAPSRTQVFEHMKEIAALFDVDGFCLDLQYFHSDGCFCAYCKEKFKKRFGYELDGGAFTEVRQWLDLYDFQADCRRDFILTAVAEVESVCPNLSWDWNHPSFGGEYKLDQHATHLGAEAHPPYFFHAIASAKMMLAMGKPFEMWMPESIGSWGHWTVTTPGTLKGMCAIALAHGGAIAFNHVAPPCGDHAGRVFQGVYDVLGEVMGWIREREDLCSRRQSVPVVAILNSDVSTRLNWALSRSADKALGVQNTVKATKLADESRVPVDVIRNEDCLDRLNEYEAVILPNIGNVRDDLADELRSYVKGGGKLLATYNTSLLDEVGSELPNFALADLFGADFVEYSEYSINYLYNFEQPIKSALPDLPLLVKDVGYQEKSPHKAIYCRLSGGAQALATFTEPIIESDWTNGQHIYHDHAPPGDDTQWPAIIVNRYGSGMCVFLPFPILSTYDFESDPRYRTLIRQLVSILGAPERLNWDAPISAHVTATQDADGWLVHVINIQKETGSVFLNETPPSGNMTIRVKPDWPVKYVKNAVTGECVGFQTIDGTTCITIPAVGLYEIIRIGK